MAKRLAAVLVAGLMLAAPQVWAQGKGKGKGKGETEADKGPDAKGEGKGEVEAGGEGAGTSDVEGNELNLVVGENKTIPASSVKNYSMGVKGIAEVKLTTDNSKFVVSGMKPGTTTLLLINKDDSTTNWVINVFSRSPDAVRRELTQLLGEMPGVRVRRVGSRFFVEGGVASDGDVKRIEKIAALYPGQVESLVVAGGGGVSTASKVNIRVDFFFIRYDKSSGYAVGIDWPSRIGGAGVVQNQFTYDFLAGTTTTAEASVVNQPLPALDIASRRGWAKVLKQSTVITTNGNKATWELGQEQNFQVSGGLSSTIKEIVATTKVDVLPRLDEESGELEVQLEADIADFAPPVDATTLPGRNISKLKTLVRMKLGQSLVLSGVRAANQRHDIRGLPILSEIPVLGVLFGTHRDSLDDVEGALFIIPTAVESVPKPAIEIVNGALSQYEEYSGDIDAINAYNKRPQQWRKVNK